MQRVRGLVREDARLQGILGRFDIDTYLAKIGKGHAWVPAADGVWPQYGDIFRPKSFHMGISLDYDGDLWNTAESGQGGPKAGCDIIKRKQRPYDGSKLKGWVDLELYFNSPAQVGPVPAWLVGWWKVIWRAGLLLLLLWHPPGEMDRVREEHFEPHPLRATRETSRSRAPMP